MAELNTEQKFHYGGPILIITIFFFIGIATRPAKRQEPPAGPVIEIAAAEQDLAAAAETDDLAQAVQDQIDELMAATEDILQEREETNPAPTPDLKEEAGQSEAAQTAESSVVETELLNLPQEEIMENFYKTAKGIEDVPRDAKLDKCKIQELGVKFSCNLNWEIQQSGDKNLVVLSSDPLITLSYGKMNEKISLLEQLSAIYFKDKNIYLDGFKTEKVRFAGRQAVKVKAFSKTNPEIRHVDYFYIHDDKLYGVNFSLYPKKQWEDGKFIIKDIADSFAAL